jgi:uncharacterized membrane protein YvbJ
MVYCTKCGESNEEGTEYCVKCGASLTGSTKVHRSSRYDREMCFGVPMSGSLWGILVGAVIVLWGLTELLRIDINFAAIVAVAFGAIIVINALRKSSG